MISVGQYIADSMGKELKVENMSFEYLLPSLVKGDFDIVIAAMEADGDRLKSADFSDPYYTDMPPAILVKASDAASYKTLADFAGKSVAAQTGTTKLDIVNDQLTGANAVPLALVTDMVNELVNGKVDAIVVDGAVAKQYAETNRTWSLLMPPPSWVPLSPTVWPWPRATPRVCCRHQRSHRQDERGEQAGELHQCR